MINSVSLNQAYRLPYSPPYGLYYSPPHSPHNIQIHPMANYPLKSYLSIPFDSIKTENTDINKNPLVERKIISPNQNLNTFFNNISDTIFYDNKKKSSEFSSLLKKGFISLSSSIYNDLNYPYSAVAINLEEGTDYFAQIRPYMSQGVGVGMNLSNFENPVGAIHGINTYFKLQEKSFVRPPAGIALLDINHPKALDFIKMKRQGDYENWCFDTSVIINDESMKNKNKNRVYEELLKSMLKTGEPGVIFSNDKNYITDPCGVAPLKREEGLTLGFINMSKFYNKEDETIDYNLLKKSASLLDEALAKLNSDHYISVLGYQDLLDKMGLEYGSKEALAALNSFLSAICEYNLAISPSSTTSRILKTTPNIQPKENTDWTKVLKTLSVAQKYMRGNISNTIHLDKNATIKDVDAILTLAHRSGMKGLTVFRD